MRRKLSILLVLALCLGLAVPAAASGELSPAEDGSQSPASVETEAPAEIEEPSETDAPAETEKPAETEAPAETEKPAETEAPAETAPPEEPAEEPAAPAADGDGYLGSPAKGFKWTLADGTLTVTGKGAMPDLKVSDKAPWYDQRDEVTDIVVSDGVTTVGEYVFQNLYSLATVTLPEGVTAIGYSAFRGSTMTSLSLPVSLASVGTYAFSGCTGLRHVDYAGTEAQWSAITMNPNNDILRLAYYGEDHGELGGGLAWSLTVDGRLAISGEGAISGYSVNSSAIPWRYARLTSIVIEKGVTAVGASVFYNTAAEELSLPEGLVSIGDGAFAGAHIRTVDIPDTVTTIGRGAFNGCPELTRVVMPAGLSECGMEVFSGCGALKELILPEGMTYLGWLSFSGCSGPEELTVPESLTVLPEGAFSGMTGLRRIHLSRNTTSLGYAAFSGCTALESLEIPAGVTEIPYNMAEGCTALARVSLPAGLAAVRGDAFSGCVSLTAADYPGTEEQWNAIEIEEGNDYLIFARTGALTGETGGLTWRLTTDGTLTISGSGDMPDYSRQYSDQPWYGYRDTIRRVVVEPGVTSVGTYAFLDCTKLTEAQLGADVVRIGTDAFRGCPSLAEAPLPAGLTELGGGAFYGCALTEASVPAGVTVLCEGTFAQNPGLVTAALPAGLERIEKQIFAGCKALETVDYAGSQAQWDAIDLDYDNLELLRAISVELGGTIGGLAWRVTKDVTRLEITGSGPLELGGEPAPWSSYMGYLKELVIGEGVTAVDEKAFSGAGFETVALPSTLTEIGAAAFSSEKALATVDLPGGASLGDGALSMSGLQSLTVDGEVLDFMELMDRYGVRAISSTPLLDTLTESWYNDSLVGSWLGSDGTLSLVGRLAARRLMESGEVTDMKTAYDWLCKNCGYTLSTGLHVSYADGPFFYGRASCNGVAEAMRAFLDELGYPNFIMEGTVYGSYGRQKHAWNEVYIEGTGWRLIDATDTKPGDYSSYLVSNTAAENGYTKNGYTYRYTFDAGSLSQKQAQCLAGFTAAAASDQPLSFTQQDDGSFWVTGCERGTRSVTIPDAWEGAPVTGIGDSAFAKCSFLGEITVPEGITRIGISAFEKCIGLREIVLPSTVTSVDAGAFTDCVSLRRADLAKTHIEDLPSAVFLGCVSLSEIRLPASVRSCGGLKISSRDLLVNNTGGALAVTVYGYRIEGRSPVEEAAQKLKGYTFVCLGDHEHSWDEGVFTDAPDCVKSGTARYTCTGCGETRTETVPALGHDLEHHEGSAPSCTEPGWTAYDACTRCDYSTYAELPALGHELTHTEAKPATTLAEGHIEYWQCGRCDRLFADAAGRTGITPADTVLPKLVPGDANGDGAATPWDAVQILRYAAGLGPCPEGQGGDADGDGRITVRDAVPALR